MFIDAMAILPSKMNILAKKRARENLPRCLICNMNALYAEPQKPYLPETAKKAKAERLM